MAVRGGLDGIDNVMANLNKSLKKLESLALPGMIQAAAHVRRDMEVTSPTIPIDTSNLRSSWTVNSGRSFKGPFVVMGFTALYAAAVHEMIGENINWNRPGSGAKFFEAALTRNKDEILNIIGGYMKL